METSHEETTQENLQRGMPRRRAPNKGTTKIFVAFPRFLGTTLKQVQKGVGNLPDDSNFPFGTFFHETALAFASLSALLRAVNSSPYSFSAGSSSLSPDPPTRLRLILPWERKTFLSHGKPFCGRLDRTVPTASTSSTPRPLCLRGTILA